MTISITNHGDENHSEVLIKYAQVSFSVFITFTLQLTDTCFAFYNGKCLVDGHKTITSVHNFITALSRI